MSAPACVVVIGSEASDHVRLTISDADSEDWRRVHIGAAFAPFSGSFECQAMTADFTVFRDQLKALYSTLGGEAHLSTLEGNIDLVLKGDGRGGVALTGTIRPDIGCGASRLTIEKMFDQTFLPSTIASLELLPPSAAKAFGFFGAYAQKITAKFGGN